MTQPANRPRSNTSLLLALGIAGLILIVLGTHGCLRRTFGIHIGWPLDFNSWRWGFFGPFSMFGLWGIGALVMLALAIWVGADANRRGLNGFLWGLLVFFTSIVGLIVYLIVAPTLEAQRNGVAPPAAPPPRGGPPADAAVAGAAGSEPQSPQAVCANCATPVRPDFRVCPNCGEAIGASCRECSRRLEPVWKVCPYCGTRV